MKSHLRAYAFLAALGAAALSVPAGASTIVVNHDEWTLSDTGFAQAADTTAFVENLVGEFGTSIHAYSDNFGFTQPSLASAMASAGASYSYGTSGFAFTLTNLSGYDAIFLGGTYLTGAQLAVLSDYVADGGNVYIAGGTGVSGAMAEANAWNSFLAPFGVQMDASYDGIQGVLAVSGDSLFDSVAGLYQNNGNGLSGSSVVCCGNEGLFAVYRTPMSSVPVPAAAWLLITALAGLVPVARRRA